VEKMRDRKDCVENRSFWCDLFLSHWYAHRKNGFKTKKSN